MDNKRYFAKHGGIARMIQLMGQRNPDIVKTNATIAAWNFSGTEKLGRLLLGEGVLAPLITSLKARIPRLQRASVGALWYVNTIYIYKSINIWYGLSTI